MTHEERVKSVAMCPLVDEVISHPSFYPTIEFADNLKVKDCLSVSLYHSVFLLFQIDLVAHDALPYKINEDMTDIEDCYAPFKVVHCLKNQMV